LSIFLGVFIIKIFLKSSKIVLYFAHALLLFVDCISFVFHRFTELDDYRWFYKTIERVAEEELGTKYQLMAKKEEYFVDFLRYYIYSHSYFIFISIFCCLKIY
jgi:hypothetical protein